MTCSWGFESATWQAHSKLLLKLLPIPGLPLPSLVDAAMGKKNRKNRRPHSVLSSLKDLGMEGRDTLSRLATTVKADMPTLVLGTKAPGTVKNDGIRSLQAMQLKPASRLSRFAQRLVPFKGQPAAAWPERQTTQKMQKLAHQMAMGKPKLKVRRSRLPFLVVLLALLCVGGGTYVYQSVSLPDVKIAQYLDYQTWLGLASGELKPGTKPAPKATTIVRTAVDNKVQDRMEPRSTYAGKSKLRITAKATTSKKGGKNLVKTSKGGKSSLARSSSHVGHGKVSKKSKLASLKKGSVSSYKTTSFKKARSRH